MKQIEDLNAFYNRIHYKTGETISQNMPHINVFERQESLHKISYSRRNFYKVILLLNEGRLDYAEKSLHITKPALMFSNPMIPYKWQNISESQAGWFCIFNESFIKQRDEYLLELPVFRPGYDKVYFPDEKTVNEISLIFRKMLEENESSYAYKQDILKNYLHLIIHHALKMKPANNYEQIRNAASRITSVFLELLERQFPIDSMQNRLKLKSANDYARQLSIHTNHLNRAVKQTTGKTTSEHISERIAIEATELLLHTDWPIAEIGYCLGFEYPAYFDNFFKKATGKTPKEARIQNV